MIGLSKQGTCVTATQLRRALLLGTAMSGVFVAPVAAQTTWQLPATGNDWFLSGNWSGGVPTAVLDANLTANNTTTFPAIISAAGAVAQTINIDRANTLTVTGSGTLTATAINVQSGTTAGSRFQVLAGGSASFSGLMLVGLSTSAAGNNVLVDGAGSKLTFATGSQIGVGTTAAGSTLTISNGGTVNAGATLKIGTTSQLVITGTTAGTLNAATTSVSLTTTSAVVTFSQNDTTTFAPFISGTGSLTQAGIGTTVLSGNNTYTGATVVNAGTLVVAGTKTGGATDINSTGTLILTGVLTSNVGVNSGGTFLGTGTMTGNVTVANGGTFGPGTQVLGQIGATPMAVTGSLIVQAGGTDFTTINSAHVPSVSAATFSTTATLASGSIAKVNIVGGAYTPLQTYTFLTATGGVTGTFTTTTLVNPNYDATVQYTANTAFVTGITAHLGNGAGLGTNQGNVAGAINTFANLNPLPSQFFPLFNLTGASLSAALTQLDGEVATGVQRAAFSLQGQFLNVMLDPFVDGRSGGTFCAGEDRNKITKAPMACREERTSVWSAAFGGMNRTHGNAVDGTTDVTASTFAGAVGVDFKVGSGTTIGASVGGGGTYWNLSNGLGKANSDAFQAGVYGVTKQGAAYLGAAFAYTNHWISTDRNVIFSPDNLKSKFDAHTFGARVEGGWAFTPSTGATFTPYAAWTGQWLHTPSYGETDTTGGGFGLNFAAHDTSTNRVESGIRLSYAPAGEEGGTIALRAKLAYAHDWYQDPALTASFQALSLSPGSNFLVTGARPGADLFLMSAGPEVRYANGITVAGKIEGEFAKASQSYLGKAYVRYSW